MIYFRTFSMIADTVDSTQPSVSNARSFVAEHPSIAPRNPEALNVQFGSTKEDYVNNLAESFFSDRADNTGPIAKQDVRELFQSFMDREKPSAPHAFKSLMLVLDKNRENTGTKNKIGNDGERSLISLALDQTTGFSNLDDKLKAQEKLQDAIGVNLDNRFGGRLLFANKRGELEKGIELAIQTTNLEIQNEDAINMANLPKGLRMGQASTEDPNKSVSTPPPTPRSFSFGSASTTTTENHATQTDQAAGSKGTSGTEQSATAQGPSARAALIDSVINDFLPSNLKPGEEITREMTEKCLERHNNSPSARALSPQEHLHVIVQAVNSNITDTAHSNPLTPEAATYLLELAEHQAGLFDKEITTPDIARDKALLKTLQEIVSKKPTSSAEKQENEIPRTHHAAVKEEGRADKLSSAAQPPMRSNEQLTNISSESSPDHTYGAAQASMRTSSQETNIAAGGPRANLNITQGSLSRTGITEETLPKDRTLNDNLPGITESALASVGITGSTLPIAVELLGKQRDDLEATLKPLGKERAAQLIELFDKKVMTTLSEDDSSQVAFFKAALSRDPVGGLEKLQTELKNGQQVGDKRLTDAIGTYSEAHKLAGKARAEEKKSSQAAMVAVAALVTGIAAFVGAILSLVAATRSKSVAGVEIGDDGAIDDQINQLEEENRGYENDLAGKGKGVPDPGKQEEYQSNFDNAQKQIDESGYNFDSNNMDEIEKLVEDKYLKDNFKGYDIDKETNEIIVPQYLKDEAAAEAKQIRALYEERQVAETQMKHVENQHKIAELKDQKAAHQAAHEKATEPRSVASDGLGIAAGTLGFTMLGSLGIGASLFGGKNLVNHLNRKKGAQEVAGDFQRYMAEKLPATEQPQTPETSQKAAAQETTMKPAATMTGMEAMAAARAAAAVANVTATATSAAKLAEQARKDDESGQKK